MERRLVILRVRPRVPQLFAVLVLLRQALQSCPPSAGRAGRALHLPLRVLRALRAPRALYALRALRAPRGLSASVLLQLSVLPWAAGLPRRLPKGTWFAPGAQQRFVLLTGIRIARWGAFLMSRYGNL